MQKIQWFTAGGGGGGGTSFWTADGDNIYNNNSGNVGVGTATPLAKLEVQGNSTDGWIRLSTSGGNPFITSTNNLSFKTGGGSEILYLRNPDRVGINIGQNANANLHVRSTNDTSGTYAFLADSTTGAGLLTVRGDGNVGVGTLTPSARLQVDGNVTVGGGTTTGPVKLNILGTGSRGGSIRALSDGNGSAGLYFNASEGLAGGSFFFAGKVFPSSNLGYSLGDDNYVWSEVYTQKVRGRNNTAQGTLALSSGTTSNPVSFQVANVEYARLDGSGNFGIGTTSPATKLDVVGTAQVTGNTTFIGTSTVKGQFEVERSDNTANLLTVSDASMSYRIAGNATVAQVTFDRDGSTSSDVVALKIGSNITIKRNGGGTPAFTVGNAGFIYTQNYNGNTVSNTNPFNNGAGMGIRNTTQGSKVILALHINGVFGALNTAGANLDIGNPVSANNNWLQGHSTTFRNASNFIIEGVDTTASISNRWIFRHSNYTSGGVSDTDYRTGTGISGCPNLQVTIAGSGFCTMTNGSDVVTTSATLRSWIQAGVMIYFNTATGGASTVVGPSTVGYEVVEILSSTSFRISGNWAGDNINVYAYAESASLTIRNWKKDIVGRFLANGRFQVGSVSTGFVLPNQRGTTNQILQAVSGEVTEWTSSPVFSSLVLSTSFSSSGAFGFSGTTPSAAQTGYKATASSSNRIFDSSTVTLADLANVMANLVNDLVAKGIIAE